MPQISATIPFRKRYDYDLEMVYNPQEAAVSKTSTRRLTGDGVRRSAGVSRTWIECILGPFSASFGKGGASRRNVRIRSPAVSSSKQDLLINTRLPKEGCQE